MTWQRRIERAEELAAESPVYPEVLHFYCDIARFQAALAAGPPPANLAVLRAFATRPADGPLNAFCARVLQQSGANTHAPRSAGPHPHCPTCGAPPLAAVIRPAHRFFLCDLCFTEWECNSPACPHCGESDAAKRPARTDAEMPHVAVEACDTCRTYLKSIDLTCNPRAVPEVDELAAVLLDMWAAAQGYTKLHPNLFGL